MTDLLQAKFKEYAEILQQLQTLQYLLSVLAGDNISAIEIRVQQGC